MAYKITRRQREQDLRFPNERAARRYLDQVGSDATRWRIETRRRNSGSVPHIHDHAPR